MITKAPQAHAVLTVLARESRRSPAGIVPARLSPQGLRATDAPSLSARDRVRFETALAS
jgi:hypothetical protein